MKCDEIFAALDMLEKERGISPTFMMEKIIQALTTAYKKDHEGVENVIGRPWMMTCLPFPAAMRPNSTLSTGMFTTPPRSTRPADLPDPSGAGEAAVRAGGAGDLRRHRGSEVHRPGGGQPDTP